MAVGIYKFLSSASMDPAHTKYSVLLLRLAWYLDSKGFSSKKGRLVSETAACLVVLFDVNVGN